MCQHCLPRRSLSTRTIDRGPSFLGTAFARIQKAETRYVGVLRGVVEQIGRLLRRFDLSRLDQVASLSEALLRYAQTLAPWARTAAQRMVDEVVARNATAWRAVAQHIEPALLRAITAAPVGLVVQERVAEQVRLITALPADAAERVRRVAERGIARGWSVARIATEIRRTEAVTQVRADLIARTEVARTATEMTRIRAHAVGSTHFIWRTRRDERVRRMHHALEGRSFPWNDPPECDPGHRTLPGCIWNCRCWAEPVLNPA